MINSRYNNIFNKIGSYINKIHGLEYNQYFLQCHGMLLAYADRKLTELQEKYPDIKDEIEEMVSKEPIKSKPNKYLNWAVKILAVRQAKSDEIIDVLQLFDKLQSKLDKKDINAYQPREFADLRNTLFELSQHKTETQIREEAKSGGVKLFEDDDYILIRTDTHGAACYYGKGTKWCITMENGKYYTQYVAQNVVFYMLIDKKLDVSNALHKIAFAIQRHANNSIGKIDIFNAEDTQIPESSVPQNILSIVKQDAISRPKTGIAKVLDGEGSEQDILENINNHRVISKLLYGGVNLTPTIMSALTDSIVKSKDNYTALQVANVIKNYDYPNKINDINKLEQVVTSKNPDLFEGDMASLIFEFAVDIPGANIEKLQRAMMKLPKGSWLARFANEVPNADVGMLEQAIIESGNEPEMITFAARADKADIKKIQEIVINSGIPIHILMFARDVKGADINRLQNVLIDKAIKEENGVYIFMFARDVKGADIDALQKAVIKTNSETSMLRFVRGVKGANIELFRQEFKKRRYTDKEINEMLDVE